jgi:adenine-specific DNA-methyltransferase
MQLIKDATEEKLRGAYYTPSSIASFILHWGINGSTDYDILEPSCGDGVFLDCMNRGHMAFHSVTAVEYEEGEADKARKIGLHDSEVIHSDFHRFCLDTDRRFDLVVGNPPFIRYQYYDESQQELASEIFQRSGLKRSKLTNAWVTFVVGSCQLLKERGKIGFVIPTDLLQVTYAKQLRQFLAQQFNKINIITFENLVFEEIQQEVVLLLCEKDGSDKHLIGHIEVKDSDGLENLDPHRLNLPTKTFDFYTDKWTYYFLDKEELDFLNRIKTKAMPRISTYANVEVGITTGANDYFTVPQSIIDFYNLQAYARPMVGRSVQVNSLCFTHQDWMKNIDGGAKANILVFTPGAKENGTEGTKEYIAEGERQGINKGYKTSIRDVWYVIPSIKLSDALFLRRNNVYPKFVLNEANAYTTDTMHRVFIHEGVNHKAFVASYYNSLSFAFAEILGRNFGGGVLELMPSEVGGIYLPYREENEAIFNRIDTMLREKMPADKMLDITDEILLRQGMGFTEKEVQMSRSIWHKLMERRLNRETLERPNEEKVKANSRVKQLDLFETWKQYPDNIVVNAYVHEDISEYHAHRNFSGVDLTKNVLISLVKDDNVEHYLDQSAKIYYTGKKFPATVALNKLYYFMPYIKHKGIRDLNLIKIARIGTRKEGQSDNDPNDIRLVFEIEFIGELFHDYRMVDLEIWHTFTDTKLSELMKMNKSGDD